MKSTTLIIGGARSGKSRFAESTALAWSPSPVYLATSRVWDDDHQKRIERHRRDRGPEWTLLEEEKYPSRHGLVERVIVFDCVTLFLTNYFLDEQQNERCVTLALDELKRLMDQNNHLLLVTNELGMSLHAETEVGRQFTDYQGFLNQRLATLSDRVILMVAGLPLAIKGSLPGPTP